MLQPWTTIQNCDEITSVCILLDINAILPSVILTVFPSVYKCMCLHLIFKDFLKLNVRYVKILFLWSYYIPFIYSSIFEPSSQERFWIMFLRCLVRLNHASQSGSLLRFRQKTNLIECSWLPHNYLFTNMYVLSNPLFPSDT